MASRWRDPGCLGWFPAPRTVPFRLPLRIASRVSDKRLPRPQPTSPSQRNCPSQEILPRARNGIS